MKMLGQLFWTSLLRGSGGNYRLIRSLSYSVLSAVLFLLSAAPLSALGVTEESDFRPVTGRENWSHEIPVQELDPGTYNLLIRATDSAGNQAYGGPINVEIDPDSDIPGVTISTPTEEAVVGSRMVVLGTATDDDDVSQVTVQLDDGSPVVAQGTEFWSASFDLSATAEGVHTVTAVATDSNGIASEPRRVSFSYDGSGPRVSITAPEAGSLITGTVRIEGSVSDPNGLKTLTVRKGTEGEEEELRIRDGRPEDDLSYKFESEDEEDGPVVLWFTAEDATGSVTQFPLLLFVDNTAPELQLFTPTEEVFSTGSVLFSGSVTDAVGVTSLDYETSNGETGSLDLTPGDPFWYLAVPFEEGRRGEVKLIARDEAGNESTLEHRVELDADADLPLIDSLRVTETHIFGEATDDDGIMAVEYAVDRGEWNRVESSRGFAIPLPQLDPGRHELRVRAVDLNGRAGPAVEEEITFTAPRPRIASLQAPQGPFYPGGVIEEGEELLLRGSVTNLWEGSRLEYRRDQGEWTGLRLTESGPGQATFELTVGRRDIPGRHDLELRVTNEAGEGETLATFYYLLQQLPEEPDPQESYLTEIPDDPGLYLPTGRLEEGAIRFGNERPLIAFVAGHSIAGARLEPPTESFGVTVEQENVLIAPRAPGRAEEVVLLVETEDGTLLRSDPLNLLYDVAPPTLEILAPERLTWASGEINLQVTATDDLEELTVEYALGEGAFTSLETGENGYVETLPAPAQEGAVHITVRATDRAGNSSVAARSYIYDATPPAITAVAPTSETPVNGTITVVGVVDDASPLSEIRWSADGREFQTLERQGFFSFPVDLTQYVESPPETAAPAPEAEEPGEDQHASEEETETGSAEEPRAQRPVIEVVDRAGNVGRLEMSFPLAVEEDRPTVAIQLPPPESVQREDFVISGTVFDDDGVADIEARIDDGEYESIGSGDTFSFPISIEELGDNEHTVTVRATDLGGVVSEPVRVTFFISLSNPLGRVSFPELAESVRGRVVINGTASDPNGIESVRLSFDNGNTFVGALPQGEEGLETWEYALESAVLKDGLHALQLEVTDGYGTKSLLASLITIDNSPPEVKLDLPEDGEPYYETLLLSGRVSDNERLAAIEATMTPRGAQETEPVTVPVELLAGGVLRQELDLSTLPPGEYDISVTAWDESENRHSQSRNVTVLSSLGGEERVEIYSPFWGDQIVGTVVVEGRLFSHREIGQIVVRLDGTTMGTAELSPQGFFSYRIGAEALTSGEHTVTVSGEASEGENLESQESSFSYLEYGPWVTVESHRTGDAVSERPTLSGSAGYTFLPPEGVEEGSRDYRRAITEYEVSSIEVSIDDGATWDRASGAEEWEYRLDTADIPDGWLPVLVRATAENGERGYRRLQILLDTLPPVVTLELPRQSARFNDMLLAAGSAGDTNNLTGVEAILRQGSLSRYEVPEFIQGLYGDFHVLGASSWDVGLGLTFFDDNVKLQGQLGYAPPGRFSGLVVGGKLLANVARFPFSYWFGPDLDFLSASVALGANFSYFNVEGLVLGGIVGQLEFPIINNESWRVFNQYSLYTEAQLWFISSDIQGGTETKLSFGLRVQLL